MGISPCSSGSSPKALKGGPTVPAMVQAAELETEPVRFFNAATDTSTNGCKRAARAAEKDAGLELDSAKTRTAAARTGPAAGYRKDSDDASSNAGGHEGAPGAGRLGRAARKALGTAQRMLCMRILTLVPECAQVHLGALANLSELQLCMVGTSVQDVCLNSSVAFVQDKQQNRLDSHFKVCVRERAQRFFSEATFSF